MEMELVKPTKRNKPQLQFHEHGYKPDVKEVDQI
jgi:hypothetical protein